MAKVKTYPTVEHVIKVTDFKTKIEAEGAIETLKWLDEGAPHKLGGLKGNFYFNMEFFIKPHYNDEKDCYSQCGTVCCIAGAIYAFSNKIDGNDKNNYIASGVLDESFGLDVWGDRNTPLSQLFYGYGWNIVTPKQAAKTLRKYLKKGKVDWSHVGPKVKD